MALNFLSKQLQHAQALVRLAEHPDSSLVVRSMLEGLCLLKWTAQEPTRALRWRQYAAILDVRTARAMGGATADESSQIVALALERVSALGDEFLSEKALKARDEGRPAPTDPWVTRWYRPQLRQIFEAVQAEALYEGPYQSMSEWHHWSPGGLAQGMRRDGDALSFDARSRTVQAGSLASAFQCVAATALLVGEHFDLDGVVAIANITSAFTQDTRVTHAFRDDAP
ncbi:MAG TPA: DUF5677 domain-containing protein [Gemmatimonadaceae bacterium]|nr:DUF5677 domain-containing protein [Gemmatimonadaceae bacterium]